MMIVIMVLVPQCITKSHIGYKHQQEQYTHVFLLVLAVIKTEISMIRIN